MIKKIIIPVFLLFLSSCSFGKVDTRGSVVDYKNGVVTTEGGSFAVGGLGPAWVKQSFDYKTILFKHSYHKASISVDAFCKGSFDDASLGIMTNQLLYGLTNQKRSFQRKIKLDNHEALRTRATGAIDGIPVALDIVVLKMNECVFDFVYTSSPGQHLKLTSDFERFYQGFHFIQ